MKDTSNDAGLTLEYALEIVWMVYPPEATGLDAKKRYLWMKPVADGEGGDVAFMGKCSYMFHLCNAMKYKYAILTISMSFGLCVKFYKDAHIVYVYMCIMSP